MINVVRVREKAVKHKWEFKSLYDVRRFWRNVRTVPRRTQGRQHHHEECYCLGLYLLALAEHQVLAYPLRIEQGEAPDFMLTWKSGERTGLEVTRATEQWAQRVATLAEREYEQRKAKAGESGDEPEPVCIPPSRRGSVGDEPEREWCYLIYRAVEQKLAKLSHFRRASRHDLLIYDDTPLPAVDRRKVLAAIKPWFRKFRGKMPTFQRVSVVVSLDVLYDLEGRSQIFPYIEWSAPDLSNPQDLYAFSERIEDGGRRAVERAIRSQTGMRKAVYFQHNGKIVKLAADGRRFEVRLQNDSEEVVIRELPRR